MLEDHSNSGARRFSETGSPEKGSANLEEWGITVDSITKKTLDLISAKTGESASEIIVRLVRDEADNVESLPAGEEKLDDLPEYEWGGGV